MRININDIDYYVYYVEQRIIRSSAVSQLPSYTFNEVQIDYPDSKIFVNIVKPDNKKSQLEFLISKTKINRDFITRKSVCGRPLIYIINEDFIQFLKKFDFEFIKDRDPICFSKNYVFEKQMYDEKIGVKIVEAIKENLSKA